MSSAAPRAKRSEGPKVPVKRHLTRAAKVQCIAVNHETGLQCKANTVDSTNMCVMHRKSNEEKENDKVLKCHKCMRVVWKDAKALIPDIERTRIENCPKAFWRSHGNRRMWLRDLCWYDIQTFSIDYSNVETAMREMEGILRDERMQIDKTRRYMADEGGLMTPDYIRMVNQHYGHLETLIKLKSGIPTGPFGNLKGQKVPALGSGGPSSDEAKAQFMTALFGSDDGTDDDIKMTKTTITKETVALRKQEAKPEANPTVLDVEPNPSDRQEDQATSDPGS